MVQNFCCCWCLVLLVTVGRSALRFGTRSGRSVPIQQATDDSTAGLYYGALHRVYTTTTTQQQFEAVRSFKAGVGIHHYTMTTIRLQLGRQQYIRVRLYWSYTRRTTTAHSSSSRRWRRRCCCRCCCCWSYSQCRSCMHGSGSEPLPFRWQQLQPCLHNSYYYQTTTTTPTASCVSR